MHRIVSVRALPGYRLNLSFEDGVAGEVDLSDLVGKGVFAAWTDPGAFDKVYIDQEGHTVAWPSDIDLCPENLYQEVAAISAAGCVIDKQAAEGRQP